MSILKRKVSLIATRQETDENQAIDSESISDFDFVKEPLGEPLKESSNRRLNSKLNSKSQEKKTSPKAGKQKSATTRNIVKNYGRAFINFAVSKLALPYLNPCLQSEGVKLRQFRDYILRQKDKINCIVNLRELLLPHDGDTREVRAYRKIFQTLCEVFIKYFSVNWIYSSGKLYDKMSHLKCRYKILRRIRDPVNFTYFEAFS